MKSCWLLFLALLLCPAAWSLGADDLKPSEVKTKTVLHAAISGQLEAFRKDDYATAYGFADPAIQGKFSIEDFERMVRASFPAIAHSTSAKFGLTFDNGDEAVINVRVFSTGREPVDYQYTMHRDGEAWRITGVTLLKDNTTEV